MEEVTQDRQPAQRPGTGVMLYRPAIVGLLYLLNIFLAFSVFVGLILAYIWRSDPETQDWERTHYTYLIRTFWIGLAVFAVMAAAFLAMVFAMVVHEPPPGEAAPVGFLVTTIGAMVVFFAGAIWFCLRCILSLVKASGCRPMPNPQTWLF